MGDAFKLGGRMVLRLSRQRQHYYRVDAFPARVFHGRVEQIRQRAEFLPRNVQTRAERVHQVIGVKVRVEDAHAELRAGTAAEVRFPPRST